MPTKEEYLETKKNIVTTKQQEVEEKSKKIQKVFNKKIIISKIEAKGKINKKQLKGKIAGLTDKDKLKLKEYMVKVNERINKYKQLYKENKYKTFNNICKRLTTNKNNTAKIYFEKKIINYNGKKYNGNFVLLCKYNILAKSLGFYLPTTFSKTSKGYMVSNPKLKEILYDLALWYNYKYNRYGLYALKIGQEKGDLMNLIVENMDNILYK